MLAQGIEADLGYGFARCDHPFLSEIPRQIDLQSGSVLPLWRQFKLARAFQTRTTFLSHYDTVIYSGFYTPLAIKNHRQGRNILYCHTPPRFIYDQRDFYLNRLPVLARPLLKRFIAYLQPRYEAALRQMDVIVTNSANVQQRIHRYLGLEAKIVYPPCDTSRFQWLSQQPYYLSTARLDPLKRVDLIVQAFLSMPEKQLVVASGGSELRVLQKLARGANNIRFTGWLSEPELLQLIGNATAVIYLPQDEDFGMSPVESMAAGKPVIGVAEGGLLETILHGETGLLLPPAPSAATIAAAVSEFTHARALSMRFACEKQAQNFRLALFIQKMREILHSEDSGLKTEDRIMR